MILAQHYIAGKVRRSRYVYRRSTISYIFGVVSGLVHAFKEGSPYYDGCKVEIDTLLKSVDIIFDDIHRLSFGDNDKLLEDFDLSQMCEYFKFNIATLASLNGHQHAIDDLKSYGADYSEKDISTTALGNISELMWIQAKYPEDEFLESMVRILTPLLSESTSSQIVLIMPAVPIIDMLKYELHRNKLYTFTIDDNGEYTFSPYDKTKFPEICFNVK